MILKANPFLFLSREEKEFPVVKSLLEEIMPDMIVIFEPINAVEVAKVENIEEVQVGTYEGAAAWFSIKPRPEMPMTLDDVVAATTEVIRALNTKASQTQDLGLRRIYQKDADAFMSIRSKLRHGAIKEAVVQFAELDDGSRTKLWTTDLIEEQMSRFILFLKANDYPNVTRDGRLF